MKLAVLGLDLAPAATGIGWRTAADLGCTWGARTVASDARGQQRINDIRQGVRHAVNRIVPAVVVIEALYVGHQNNSLMLAELHGVVKQDLWDLGIPYALVAPQTRAVYATGRGRAGKSEVCKAIRARYGTFLGGPAAIRDNDQADAIALTVMGVHRYEGAPVDVDRSHARALDSVHWPTLRIPLPASVTAPPGAGGGSPAVKP